MQQFCHGTKQEEFSIKTYKNGDISEDYTLLDPPISKVFNEIRKAQHKLTGLMRAVKIINKSQDGLIIPLNLNHPNIAKIYEVYEDDRFFYIVTDLCTGDELYEMIRKESPFTEAKAADIIRQILSAVQYYHQNSIMHRNIKPENFYYESDLKNAELKIINFGKACRFVPSQKNNQTLETTYYTAPEVFKKDYDEKCDVWSCGVILYILLCGYPPFGGHDEIEIKSNINKANLNFDPEDWAGISQEAKNLISNLLQPNPSQRYNALEALNNPWILKTFIETRLDEKILANMLNFKVKNQLQKLIFSYIVQQLLTSEEKSQLLQTFQALDTNHDGILNKEELIVGFQKINQPIDSANQLFEMIEQNNQIDYSVFLMVTADRKQLLSGETLQEAFKLFDKDRDGYITIDELKQIFSGLTEEIWTQYMTVNSDGKLTFKEFSQMMKNIEE